VASVHSATPSAHLLHKLFEFT